MIFQQEAEEDQDHQAPPTLHQLQDRHLLTEEQETQHTHMQETPLHRHTDPAISQVLTTTPTTSSTADTLTSHQVIKTVLDMVSQPDIIAASIEAILDIKVMLGIAIVQLLIHTTVELLMEVTTEATARDTMVKTVHQKYGPPLFLSQLKV